MKQKAFLCVLFSRMADTIGNDAEIVYSGLIRVQIAKSKHLLPGLH
jgi:hypothetical protein